MEIVSTNKPDIPKKPEIDIEYNNKSYESFINGGFESKIPRIIAGPYDHILKFLSQVDLRKGPIERTVTSIVRCRAVDWESPKRERKEYVYYTEDWNANNWLGIPISKWQVQSHVEGKYAEALSKPKFDERTGEHIDNIFDKTRERYYIPYSKKNVDEIISNSVHSDKSNIRFIVKFAAEDATNSDGASGVGMGMATRNQFSYDMFLWPWDKLYEYQNWPWEDLTSRPNVAGKSATKLEFKPS